MMNLFRSLAGFLRVEVTSADPGDLLGVLSGENIPVMDIAPNGELTLTLSVFRRDYPALKKICEKRGDALRITGRSGLYWVGKGLGKRPVLVLGTAFLLFLLLWIPTHVFFVQVEGNSTVPTRKILAAAEESGIYFGASRREVRSERIKNTLLEALPELRWAGVNTYGCVAVISVREKTTAEESGENAAVSSIVAATDGVILSATASRGNLLVSPGQAVTEGEVLISAYTDCGLSIQATRAEGEIYGRTRHDLTVFSIGEYLSRGEISDTSVSYSLIIGKNRINLWKDSGISGTSCGRMYEEFYITLPGGFQLPVILVKETLTAYEMTSQVTAQAEAEATLAEFGTEYLLGRMIAGTVEHQQYVLTWDQDCFRLDAAFLCTEMIGRQRVEEIGDTNEQER